MLDEGSVMHLLSVCQKRGKPGRTRQTSQGLGHDENRQEADQVLHPARHHFDNADGQRRCKEHRTGCRQQDLCEIKIAGSRQRGAETVQSGGDDNKQQCCQRR